jgi:enterochelin esterase family protein
MRPAIVVEEGGPMQRVALAALALVVVAVAPAAAQRRAPISSPEVHDDGRVTFRVRAAQADAVRVTGTDMPAMGRGVDMARGEDGLWEATVGPVDPGTYRYVFSVDGLSVLDPVNTAISESNATSWSMVTVPGAAFMDTRRVPHGAVSEVTYFSEPLGRFRRMHVYTPPGYEMSATRYPVLYLLHGAGDSDDSWHTVGRAGVILDNLIADGRAVPMVVVMTAGHVPGAGSGVAGPGADAFARDFVDAVMPEVESRYRVRTDRASRAMAGLSLGGAQTLDIGVPHLDRFAYLGVFSSGVFGIADDASFEERNRAVLDDARLKRGLELVWFSTGRDDFLIETSRATVAMLRAHGFRVDYEESDGGHTWINWREYLDELAPRLFR